MQEGEDLRAYDLLVDSLRPWKRARVERGADVRDNDYGAVKREEVAVDSEEDESEVDGEGRTSAGKGGWVVECVLLHVWIKVALLQTPSLYTLSVI